MCLAKNTAVPTVVSYRTGINAVLLPKEFLHNAFEGYYLQFIKNYTITISRCSQCWSVLDKGSA